MALILHVCGGDVGLHQESTIRDHQFFSIALCTVYECITIRGTYFTAPVIIAGQTQEDVVDTDAFIQILCTQALLLKLDGMTLMKK